MLGFNCFMKKPPIHIAFCVNNLYADYIRVSIKGLLDNNDCPIMIHVLSDYISEKPYFRNTII